MSILQVDKLRAGKLLIYGCLSSRAVTSGRVTDISDCELMIPGISFDKVSDITTNIIREKLILYTQEQCRLHGIPMKLVPSGKTWSPIEKRWLKEGKNHFKNVSYIKTSFT